MVNEFMCDPVLRWTLQRPLGLPTLVIGVQEGLRDGVDHQLTTERAILGQQSIQLIFDLHMEWCRTPAVTVGCRFSCSLSCFLGGVLACLLACLLAQAI